MCHIYDVNMILCTKRASYEWAGIVIFSIEQHLLQLFCCLQFYRNFKRDKNDVINQNYFGYVTHLEHIHHLVSNH